MKYCKQCQQKYPSGASACIACGKEELVELPPVCCAEPLCTQLITSPDDYDICPRCHGSLEIVTPELWVKKVAKPALENDLSSVAQDTSRILLEAKKWGLKQQDAARQFEKAFAEKTGVNRQVFAGWWRESVYPLRKRKNNTKEAQQKALERAAALGIAASCAEGQLPQMVPTLSEKAPPDSPLKEQKPNPDLSKSNSEERDENLEATHATPSQSRGAMKLRSGLRWAGRSLLTLKARLKSYKTQVVTCLTVASFAMALIAFGYNPPMKTWWDSWINIPPILKDFEAPREIRTGGEGWLEADYMEFNKEILDFVWTPPKEAWIDGSGPKVRLKIKSLDDLSEPIKIKVSLQIKYKFGESALKEKEIWVIPSCRKGDEPVFNIIRVGGNGAIREGDKVNVEADLEKREGEQLSYEWYWSKGRFGSDSPTVTLDTSGANPTSANVPIEITVKVRNQFCKNPAMRSTTIVVMPRQKAPESQNPLAALKVADPAPAIERCQAEKSSVNSGETVALTAEVKDESDTNLIYAWEVDNGQQLFGKRVSLKIENPDPVPRIFKVTLTVINSRLGTHSLPQKLYITVAPQVPSVLPKTTPTPIQSLGIDFRRPFSGALLFSGQ